MKKINSFRVLLILGIGILSVACGGGGGGGSDDDDVSSKLSGTWFGNLEDSLGVMHTISVVISGDEITSISNDGVDQGLTGKISRESDEVYAFELSDGTEGGFIVDDDIKHAAFLDEEFNIGAIQKGASSLPSFSQADIGVSASGIVVTTDFNSFEQDTSSVDCNASGSCTGDDGFVGAFTTNASIDNSLGRWTHSTSSSAGAAGGSIFLSADKTFAAAYSCTGSFPEGCSFSAWLMN